MTVLPKRVIHLSSCKYLTKQGVRISLLSFQPKDNSLGQNGLGGYDINVIKAYMKGVIFLTIAFLIAGCAKTSHTPDLSSSIKIKDREIKISEPILYIAEEPLFEKVVKNEKISLKEAPFEESYFVCGGVFPAEQDTAELLENAKTVLVLKGSYEKWTPIEGKSKKYIVFKLQ